MLTLGWLTGFTVLLQVDCQNVDGFPYEPSKEESTIFEYVFFPQQRVHLCGRVAQAVPRLMKYFFLMVNVTSIVYAIATAPSWSSNAPRICDTDGEMSTALLLSISAAIEGVMILCALVPAAYFLVQLKCSSNGLRQTGEHCTVA